jgi:hypothetical protein
MLSVDRVASELRIVAEVAGSRSAIFAVLTGIKGEGRGLVVAGRLAPVFCMTARGLADSRRITYQTRLLRRQFARCVRGFGPGSHRPGKLQGGVRIEDLLPEGAWTLSAGQA